MSLLDIQGLSISFGDVKAVDDVNLSVKAGETLGIIGESGSGKTMIGRAALGLLPGGGRVSGGDILYDGQSVPGMSNRALRRLRGAEIGMIFQEPMVSLNPALSVGLQMTEGLRLHRDMSRKEAEAAAVEMLGKVRFRDPAAVLRQHPHEFSGGMRQRIMLASVLLLKPRLLIADEPTTALDAIIQREILDLMMEMVKETGTTLMLVSHDLPMVARYVDRVAIMRSGKLIEEGAVGAVMSNPTQPYTERLLNALPVPKTSHVTGTPPLVEARGISVSFRVKSRASLPWTPARKVQAVRNVDLTVHEGEILGLVGESGSGKSTLGRALLHLVPSDSGKVTLSGKSLDGDFRREMQIIFQDPFSSLNPRRTVGQIVREGLRHLDIGEAERQSRIADILDRVQLPHQTYMSRLPHQMSGGQRQRISIARALVSRPRFVVADESVSALDLTVQADVLELFRKLQAEMGFAALFISHDMAVIEEIADRIIVMRNGEIVEQAPGDVLLARPQHPYTQKLLAAVPMLERKEGLLTVVHRSFDGTSETPEDDGGTGLVEVAPGHFLRRTDTPASQSSEKAFHP
ncbi:dipeptide ABC transporter ATP-binding protein [Ponticoccus alexandrii]|uniref:Dipeptide ABC transporter ATP-binding protein n=1 Tax=Ponticoccus alexandrii TaxID=1943633 RepID=A0ABX7FGP3_9RHOB|nr:ABC transporter ATP-binding protein [Ponticoccus alexandrii]QRF69362.1 dipeptide ABC transporter ATP-binding protein [Ponticoccus alexandrii]